MRARTSTAFRVNEDSGEDIHEVEAAAVVADTSVVAVGAADDEEDEVIPLLLTVRVSALEDGDEDLERDTTSTTFNAEEDEEDDIGEDGDSMLDTGGGIEDIEQESLWCLPSSRNFRRAWPGAVARGRAWRQGMRQVGFFWAKKGLQVGIPPGL